MSTYRQLKAKQLIEQPQSKVSDRPLVLIARQSTTKQIEENKESFALQIEDTRQRFIKQGWSSDIITIRVAGDGKKGVSGTLRIDQRSELAQTILDIKAGLCKAVGAYSVSRLFRDKYGVQVATFIEICAEYDVLVITPEKTYNFANVDDVTMFQLMARFAAIENEQRKKLLSDARNRKALRGEYDGRHICPGYIVDRDKESKTFDRYIEYPPHADVSRYLYRRFRELGAFNLLASEVARMPFVFPPFEDWVSPKDIKRFRLRKVPGGYHISRTSLMHLLTAIEPVGYWHVKGELLTDDEGKPILNHAPIVPFDDWEFAFTNLSFTTLNGLSNEQRMYSRSWIPTGKGEHTELLRGVLTSPLGSVTSSDGKYRVSEWREGHSQTSDTLAVDAALIDAIFQERLAARMLEIDENKFYVTQLRKLKAKQKKALVAVKEQREGFHQQRQNIQAFIAANGTKTDAETLRMYNDQLVEIAEHLFDLEDKQQEAEAEEEKLKKLRVRLTRMKNKLSVEGSDEYSKHFTKLSTEAIILNEYSGRFLTLEIKWAAPFQRVDICYIYRPFGGRQEWNSEDEDYLRLHYGSADRLDILQHFPTRSWCSIAERARKIGLFLSYDRNASGLHNRVLSYNDWRLTQDHGWTIPEKGTAHYWLYDVGDNTIETCLQTKQR